VLVLLLATTKTVVLTDRKAATLRTAPPRSIRHRRCSFVTATLCRLHLAHSIVIGRGWTHTSGLVIPICVDTTKTIYWTVHRRPSGIRAPSHLSKTLDSCNL
jgi:hypothetical protein